MHETEINNFTTAKKKKKKKWLNLEIKQLRLSAKLVPTFSD
jgi:hypothetical protein